MNPEYFAVEEVTSSRLADTHEITMRYIISASKTGKDINHFSFSIARFRPIYTRLREVVVAHVMRVIASILRQHNFIVPAVYSRICANIRIYGHRTPAPSTANGDVLCAAALESGWNVL